MQHSLPDISRTKGSPTIIFGQLVEYNMRNSFVKKLKCGGETSSRPFLKNQNWAYLCQQPEVSYNSFYCMSKS